SIGLSEPPKTRCKKLSLAAPTHSFSLTNGRYTYARPSFLKVSARLFTNRARNVLMVFGCQDPSAPASSSITSPAAQGDLAQITFMISHSASEILGILFISRYRLHL